MYKVLSTLILFIAIGTSLLFAIGVEPMSVEIEADAGASTEFILTIRGEAQDTITKITPFQPLQQETGDITYQQVDAETYSPIGWINLEQTEVEVPAGGRTDIPIRVNIPFGVRGTYILTLMVEPEAAQGEGMIQFKIRYAVRVTIRVNSSGIRENAKLDVIQFVPNEQNEPELQVKLKNNSGLDYICSVNASVRDENGRLIENMKMMTDSEQKRGQQGIRFYPDAALTFVGVPEKIVSAGTYRVQAIIKMNDFQRIFQQTLEISKDEFVFPDARDLYLIIDNTKRFLEIRPGGVKTDVIQATNEAQEPVDVTIQFTDVLPDFENSIKYFVSFRGEPKFTLQPGRANRLVSMYKIPREATPNTYYGKLIYTASKEGTPITDEVVTMAVQIGEKKTPSATLANISSNGEIVAAVLKNNGEVHLSDLLGEISVLRKETSEIISTVEVTPIDDSWVFPTQEFSLIGQPETTIPTGTMIYRMMLYDGKELILEAETEGIIE
jgi:hypothetical protein